MPKQNPANREVLLGSITPQVCVFIDVLDAQYPEKCIELGQSLEDAHRYAGVRALINRLLHLRDE